MPNYLVRRDTRLAHNGQLLRTGEVVSIDWPTGAEPQKLHDNIVEVESEAAARKIATADAKDKAEKRADAKARSSGSARVVAKVHAPDADA